MFSDASESDSVSVMSVRIKSESVSYDDNLLEINHEEQPLCVIGNAVSLADNGFCNKTLRQKNEGFEDTDEEAGVDWMGVDPPAEDNRQTAVMQSFQAWQTRGVKLEPLDDDKVIIGLADSQLMQDIGLVVKMEPFDGEDAGLVNGLDPEMAGVVKMEPYDGEEEQPVLSIESEMAGVVKIEENLEYTVEQCDTGIYAEKLTSGTHYWRVNEKGGLEAVGHTAALVSTPGCSEEDLLHQSKHLAPDNSGWKDMRDEAPIFICDGCNQSFGCNSDLQRHRMICSGEAALTGKIKIKDLIDRPGSNIQFVRCDGNKGYFTNESFQDHSHSRHELHGAENVVDFEKTVQCSQCNAALLQNTETNKSSELISCLKCSEAEMVFECKKCHSLHKTLDGLKRHDEKLHPNARTHNCKYCGKVFQRKDSLICHEGIHKAQGEDVRFYISDDQLKKPTIMVQNFQQQFVNMKTKSKNGEFLCKYCGKAFKQKDRLICHEGTHKSNIR